MKVVNSGRMTAFSLYHESENRMTAFSDAELGREQLRKKPSTFCVRSIIEEQEVINKIDRARNISH
jgi:hypothetical protein